MSLEIQYASDLHLEFPANREFLKRHPLQAVGEVLVLAGDIVPFTLMEKHQDFFRYLADQFETTYWLPGNHEYYGSDLAEKGGRLHERIRSNVILVNNTAVNHGTCKLVFSTLWSRISAGHQWQIERGLNDFHRIKYKSFRFSAEQYNELHENCMAFIENELALVQDELVAVFTHHCPTFLHYPQQYKGDVLNEAFAVELFDQIETSAAQCWVYGHHHTNTPEFVIGKTRMLTNQLGYVDLSEHISFKSGQCFEL
jgi:predicted phosphohydrolase